LLKLPLAERDQFVKKFWEKRDLDLEKAHDCFKQSIEISPEDR